MEYVQIYNLGKNAEPYLLLTCTLKGNKVLLSGDSILSQRINKHGIVDFSLSGRKKLYPKSGGRRFLEQLANNFTSTYFLISPILKKK